MKSTSSSATRLRSLTFVLLYAAHGRLLYVQIHPSQRQLQYFFYDFPGDDRLYVKIMPRFLTNPLFVGYMIPQISNPGHRERFIEALKQQLTQPV